MRKNGWQIPFDKFQIFTWVLFALQQAYFAVYVALEHSLHESDSDVSLFFIVLLHSAMTIAVVKLAFSVTNCDASFIHPEEAKRLQELAL